MEKKNWEDHFNEPLLSDLIHFSRKIEKAGKITLLKLRDEMSIGNYKLVWDNFNHHNARNISYRFGDVFISGDAPIHEIFDETNPFTERLLCTDEPVIKQLLISINQISIENMKESGKTEERIKYLISYTGILEDLKTAMRKECFKPFFMNLNTIIPHHLRCSPLEKMAKRVTLELNQIKEEQGYKYKVVG